MTLHATHITDEITWLKDQITHIAFYTEYDPFNTNDILDSGKHEIGRVAVTPSIVNNQIVINYTINSSSANCASTTISAVTSNTVFNLTSASEFDVGDRIEIDVTGNGSYQEAKIINKSSSTITIDRQLNVVVSRIVRIKLSNKAVIKNGTLTSKSGAFVYSEQFIKFKNSSQAITDNIILNLSGN